MKILKKKIAIVSLTIAAFSCTKDDVTVLKELDMPSVKIVYQGRSYSAPYEQLTPFISDQSVLINHHNAENTYLLFDNKEEMLTSAQNEYSKPLYSTLLQHLNTANAPMIDNNSQRVQWNGFNINLSDQFCSTYPAQIWNVNTPTQSGEYYPFNEPFLVKSFGASIPSGNAVFEFQALRESCSQFPTLFITMKATISSTGCYNFAWPSCRNQFWKDIVRFKWTYNP